MVCENCKTNHDGSFGSGRFCSKGCANKFSRLKDIKSTKILKCVDCEKDVEVDKRTSRMLCRCSYCKSKIKNQKLKKKKPGRTPTKPKVYCVVCGGGCKKNAQICCSRKCYFEYSKNINDEKYNTYIEKWKNGIVDGSMGEKKEAIAHNIRRYLFEKYNNKCTKCGWDIINLYTNKVPLQVDHIDGDHLNNKEDNLTLLCPNCHSLTSTYGGANRGNGRKLRYV